MPTIFPQPKMFCLTKIGREIQPFMNLEEAMMNGHSVLLRIMHKLWNFPAFIPF
jgi:hypothetical protein